MQHRLKRGMETIGRLLALTAFQIRVHHFADDGAGANDGHLHYDVVKLARHHTREGRHLRTALHLEHRDGVGLLQRFENRGIFLRQMGEVDRLAVSGRDELQAFFDDRHHAEAEQVHLDDAEVGAILFIPLHHDAAGHGGRFQRNHGVELILADHHAAGVLAEVARKVLRHAIEVQKFAYARLFEIEARLAEFAHVGVFRIVPFEGVRQAAEAFERSDFEPQRLAYFARRRAATIRDDVGGHGGAQLPEALVDILDGALALVAAGEIDIDIGPLAALFGEEALEQQFHADGIDGGNPERVTDCAVGGRTAALAEDVVLFAEAHDVPNDQEIAGQIELFDERKFAFHLALGTLVIGLVTHPRALVGAFAQERHLRFAIGDGVAREAIAQVGESEFEALGDDAGVVDGFRQIGEKARHFGGRFDVALGVTFQQPAGIGEGDVIADAGENVEEFALLASGVGRAVGGDERDGEVARAVDGGLIVGLFFALVVALNLGIKMLAAEDIEQALAGVASDAEQAAREFGDLRKCRGAFALLGAQLHAGDQAAEILIALAGFGKQRIRMPVGASNLGADMGAQSGLLRGHVEARRAVDAVAVHQRHGRHIELRAGAGEFLGHAAAFEEGECGAGVEVDEHVHHGDTEKGYFTAETQRRGGKHKSKSESAEGAAVTLLYPDAAVY